MTKTGKGGAKKPTQKLGVREIAKRVGVAPITVSRVLSNPALVTPETRKKVLKAIEAAGFVPNRIASSMKGNPVVLPDASLAAILKAAIGVSPHPGA